MRGVDQGIAEGASECDGQQLDSEAKCRRDEAL